MRGLKQGKVETKDPFFFANGAWVPWYTQHKVLAGLQGCVGAGRQRAGEGRRPLRLADWVDDVTAALTPQQLQTMLQVEHGGMREVLVDMYALTGERTLSRDVRGASIITPCWIRCVAGRDELPGKHANTQIPKITGAARSYEVTGDVAATAPSRSSSGSAWCAITHG